MHMCSVFLFMNIIIPKQSTHQRKLSRRNDRVCSTLKLMSVHHMHAWGKNKLHVYLATLVIIYNKLPWQISNSLRLYWIMSPLKTITEINIMLTWNQKGKALFSPQQRKIKIFQYLCYGRFILHELIPFQWYNQAGTWVCIAFLGPVSTDNNNRVNAETSRFGDTYQPDCIAERV